MQVTWVLTLCSASESPSSLETSGRTIWASLLKDSSFLHPWWCVKGSQTNLWWHDLELFLIHISYEFPCLLLGQLWLHLSQVRSNLFKFMSTVTDCFYVKNKGMHSRCSIHRVPTVMESQGKKLWSWKVMENQKNIKSHGRVKILP